jgi:hypothetical protein
VEIPRLIQRPDLVGLEAAEATMQPAISQLKTRSRNANDIRRRRPDRIQPQSESAHPFSLIIRLS